MSLIAAAKPALVARNDCEAGAQLTELAWIKARSTDERQRCDPFRMRLAITVNSSTQWG